MLSINQDQLIKIFSREISHKKEMAMKLTLEEEFLEHFNTLEDMRQPRNSRNFRAAILFTA